MWEKLPTTFSFFPHGPPSLVTTESAGINQGIAGIGGAYGKEKRVSVANHFLLSLKHPPDTELVVQRSINTMECNFQRIGYIAAC
jgi:hypothetical protein